MKFWFLVFVLIAGVLMVLAVAVSVALLVVETICKAFSDRGYLPYIFGHLYRCFHWCREQVEKGIRSLSQRVAIFGQPPKKGRRRRRRRRQSQ